MKPGQVARSQPGLTAALLRNMRRNRPGVFGRYFDSTGNVADLQGLLRCIFEHNGRPASESKLARFVTIATTAEEIGVSPSAITEWRKRQVAKGQPSGVYDITAKRRLVNLPEFLKLRGRADPLEERGRDLDTRIRDLAAAEAARVVDERMRVLLSVLGDQ